MSVATTPHGSTAPPLPEGGQLSHFTRAATMRVLQQVRPMVCHSMLELVQ